MILNNNDMPKFYTLLNDNDNIIRKNRRHLIKVNSNFVKTEYENDMDNDIEIESKTRHSTLVSKSGKGGRNSRECN